MVEYKDRLQMAMNDSGVSAKELAEELGASYQAVMKVLGGKSNAFSAANNAKAARMLNVSSDWLALGEGLMPREADWPLPQIDKSKVIALARDDLMQLQAGVIFAAAQLGLDVTVGRKENKEAM